MFWKKSELPAGVVNARRRLNGLPIRTRLTVCYTVSAFVMLASISAFLYWLLISGLEADERRLVLDKAKMFETALRVHGDHTAILQNEAIVEGGGYWDEQHYLVYSRILDENGKIIIETPGMFNILPESAFPEPVQISPDNEPHIVHYHTAPNGQPYFLTASVARSGGTTGPLREVQVAMDETGERAMIASFGRWILAALVLGTLLFALLGRCIVRRCLQPVEDLARSTERITANNLISRVDPDPSRWPDELSTVADSFYRMLQRLDQSYKWCSQCTQNIAHELRNPINWLMGEAEVALSRERSPEEYREVLESSLEEYTRLSRMIEEFLFVARADNPHSAVTRLPIDVRKELEPVLDFLDVQAQESGITISCEGEAHIAADPLLFRRATSNLVANALAHTSEGGHIGITIELSSNGDSVEISVTDTGCGIAPGDVPYVLDRFFQSKSSDGCVSDGSCLGLAIVKSIMTLHGGSVELESTEGVGTTVTLHFPRAKNCENCDQERTLSFDRREAPPDPIAG